MEAFDYEAQDRHGKISRGTLMASNARAARRDLRARSLTVIKMNEANTRRKQAENVKKTGRISTRILTQATRQLAILIKADTPVAESLRVTALQFENPAMRKSFLNVRARILEGRRLSEAFADERQTYSKLYTSMVAAGENSGQLALVLDRLAGDMEAAQKVRRKVLGAVIYPIVLSVVALAVIIILMVFVVPKVVQQFASFNQQLPRLTELTISLSAWLQSYGLWAGFGVFLGIVALLQMLKITSVRYRFDKFVLALPFIGGLNRDMNAARFARTMSGLLESGTPVISAISTAKNTISNTVMLRAVEQVIEQVRGGGSLGAAFRRIDVFPPLMVHMLASGETSGDLAHMFDVSADYLEEEFDGAVTIVLSLLEPFIIILLGGVVMLIVAAIFLPILRLNTLSF